MFVLLQGICIQLTTRILETIWLETSWPMFISSHSLWSFFSWSQFTYRRQ